MTEELLLSELCAICHLEVPKYKCPGCKIKTCSLICVKRHKTRSQCSGIRDAAPYKRRHELATATSMDQDFSFITRLERNVDRLAGKTEERGLTSQRPSKRPKWENRREKEIQERGPTILKAPPGLSRARQNLSKWDNQHQCLVWTIEWVFEDGFNVMASSKETLNTKDAFVQMGGRKQLKAHGKARIESQESPTTTVSPNKADLDVHFYLHRPNTPANLKCVIPLQSEASIQVGVEKRTLLEFPTIYVMSVEAGQLSPHFVTEEKYLRENESENMPTDASTAHKSQEPPATDSINVGGDPEDPKLDAAQVADVLLKDLGQT